MEFILIIFGLALKKQKEAKVTSNELSVIIYRLAQKKQKEAKVTSWKQEIRKSLLGLPKLPRMPLLSK